MSPPPPSEGDDDEERRWQNAYASQRDFNRLERKLESLQKENSDLKLQVTRLEENLKPIQKITWLLGSIVVSVLCTAILALVVRSGAMLK